MITIEVNIYELKKIGKKQKVLWKKQLKQMDFHTKEWLEKQHFTDQNLILCLKIVLEENGNLLQFNVILFNLKDLN
jgi:hypothetical protein